MRPTELVAHGGHVMTVCNACRYCEQYCPVFPAMERRMTFTADDLAYLANLCHNCGECLYACQYAPPHEFDINVPRTLAQVRLASYEELCWPRFMAPAFRSYGVLTAIAMTAAFTAMLAAGVWAFNPGGAWPSDGRGDFYAVVPHHVLVALFGGVGLFVTAVFAIGLTRFRAVLKASADRVPATVAVAAGTSPGTVPLRAAIADALTLRHLHRGDGSCVAREEERPPWRRRFHHLTFYGFALCFLSTSVAALYHGVFGWLAPYAYTSLPVVLGTVGGIGLVVGPIGLLVLKTRRDPALGDRDQDGSSDALIALLVFVSVTGLLLLAVRHMAVMSGVLIVHLGAVLALFVSLPYGKFVHGLYRVAALALSALETARDDGRPANAA